MSTILSTVRLYVPVGSQAPRLALIGVLVLLTYCPALPVSAAIITAQYGDNALSPESGIGGNPIIAQRLGTGMSGTLESVTLQLTRPTADGANTAQVRIYCFTDAYVTLCPGNELSAISDVVEITLEPFAGTHKSYSFTMTNSSTGAPYPLVSNRYYVLQYESGDGTKFYCNATTGSGLSSNGPGLGTCLAMYYVIYDNNRFTDDTDVSRIISTLPSCTPGAGHFSCDVDVATTSPVTIGGSWHIGNNDTTRGPVTVSITLTDLNIFQVLPLDGVTSLYYQSFTSPGNYASSTVVSLANGNYAVKVLISYATGATYQQSLFIVGVSSVVGGARANSLSELNDYISALSATTTEGYALQCALWNITSGAFHSCLAYLFVPNTESLVSNIVALGGTIASMSPWGYGKFIGESIVNSATSSATSSLPSLIITLPAGFPGGGQSFNITPWGMLLGAGSLLSEAHDPNTGVTLKEGMQDSWNNFIYFLFALALFYEFVGVGAGVLNRESYDRRRGNTTWS